MKIGSHHKSVGSLETQRLSTALLRYLWGGFDMTPVGVLENIMPWCCRKFPWEPMKVLFFSKGWFWWMFSFLSKWPTNSLKMWSYLLFQSQINTSNHMFNQVRKILLLVCYRLHSDRSREQEYVGQVPCSWSVCILLVTCKICQMIQTPSYTEVPRAISLQRLRMDWTLRPSWNSWNLSGMFSPK